MSSTRDRFYVVWVALVRWASGMRAVKQVDACARYWGKVVKVAGTTVDVMLDSPDIASPTGVSLNLGLPNCTVTGIEGARVLIGFRNGDLSQPFAETFEQSSPVTNITIGQSSPQPAAREGDNLNASTPMKTWAQNVEAALNSAGFPVAPTFASAAGLAGGFGDIHEGSGTVKIGG